MDSSWFFSLFPVSPVPFLMRCVILDLGLWPFRGHYKTHYIDLVYGALNKVLNTVYGILKRGI